MVLSAPVGSPTRPGRVTLTKRVTASGLSATPPAMTSSPYCLAASGLHRTAWKPVSPSVVASARAGAEVEVPATYTASGRFWWTQPRHWAQACGWVEMARTSSRRVPGRPARTKVIGTAISAAMTRGVEATRLSSVALTPPSTEFSMGTTAASTVRSRRWSRAVGTSGQGSSSTSAGATWRSAISVKVPAGPRKDQSGAGAVMGTG